MTLDFTWHCPALTTCFGILSNMKHVALRNELIFLVFLQHEEMMKQRRELSQELVTLREELGKCV